MTDDPKPEESAGGYNPDRPKKQPKPQVGPMPSDDPDHAARPNLKDEIKKKSKPASPL
jgi:hypothetical protein